jgi:hypothetical protein
MWIALPMIVRLESAPLHPVLVQVQRQYLTKRLGSLKPHSIGLTFSLLFAVLLGVLQAVFGYLTVPHEYGHAWAAQLLGHKVSVLQVDFLDQSKGLQNFFGDAAGKTGAYIRGAGAPPPPEPGSSSDAPEAPSMSSAKTLDYSRDGKLGFVLYEPSVILTDYVSFSSLGEYNTFAGASFGGGADAHSRLRVQDNMNQQSVQKPRAAQDTLCHHFLLWPMP